MSLLEHTGIASVYCVMTSLCEHTGIVCTMCSHCLHSNHVLCWCELMSPRWTLLQHLRD